MHKIIDMKNPIETCTIGAMTLLERLRQKDATWCILCEWAIVVLLILSIVWRGGKSIDITWLLSGVASFVTFSYYLRRERENLVDIPLTLWLAVIGFVGLTGLSFVGSTTQNYGLDEVMRTTGLALLLLWAFRRTNNPGESGDFVLRLLRVLALTTVGACMIGILVYTFQPVSRFVGTFFDYRFQTDYWPNAWVQFLLLSWPAVLFMALKDFAFDKKDTRSRVAFLLRSLAIGFVVGCLFLSYSRGGILVFGFQLLLWTLIVYQKTRPEFPMRRVVPVGFMIMVVALSTFIGANTMRSQIYSVQDVGEKVTFSASEGTSSITERLDFWKQSTTLALQKPFLGWGPYSFRFVQPQLQRRVLATSDHPHNLFLKMFMERGVLATVLLISVLVSVLLRTARELLSKECETGSLMFSVRIFIFLGLVGVLAHNMIDYNLQFVGIALPFWLFLGIILTYTNTSALRQVPRSLTKGVELTLALVLLLTAFYEGGYLVVSSMGRHAEAAGDTEKALTWYNRAGGEIFSRDLMLSKAKILYQESDLEGSQIAIDTYMNRNNQDYRAWKRLGDIALLSGSKQEAINAYNIAFEGGKYNDIGILRGMVEAYLASDRMEDVETMLPVIEGLLKEYADAIQVNAHFIALSPNVEELVYLANTLSRLFPDNAPKYQVMAAKADHHAQIERAKIESRPPGFLW